VPISPYACQGPCSKQARDDWAAYDQAVLDHADAIDEWVEAGQQDEPPTEPEPPTTPFWEGRPHFCTGCVNRIRTALNDLDLLAAELEATADGHRTGTPQGRVSGTKTPGSLSPVRGVLDKLYGDLTDAEDEWRQTCQFTARTNRTHRGSHPRSQTISWLLAHLDRMLAYQHPIQDHIQFGLDVLRWETVLRAMVKDEPVTRRSPIRCPRCSERQIQRAGSYWECGACGRLMSHDEHDREYAEQADEHEQQEAHAS
jgi:ribosomal protein L37AE/L43A